MDNSYQVFLRALHRTTREPVTLFTLPKVPTEVYQALLTTADLAVETGDGVMQAANTASSNKAVTFVIVAGVIIGVIFISGRTSYLITARQVNGQFIAATARASWTWAGYGLSYLYSLVSPYVTYLTGTAKQVATYSFSLLPAETVKFVLGCYDLVAKAVIQAFKYSKLGTVLRVAEARMRSVFVPLLRDTARHVSEHYGKYALAADVSRAAYRATPYVAAALRASANKSAELADSYRTWSLAMRQEFMARMSDHINAQLHPMEENERIQDRIIELQQMLPSDLSLYQQCPLSNLPFREPVRVVLADSNVRYYDREFLANWIHYRQERNLPVLDPINKMEMHCSLDELVVDDDARHIIEIMDELNLLQAASDTIR